ncbi:protein MAL2 isoform X2 [Scleropages formosus]|uniref:protein MAL2 isoform X2 n=1 Tax=Scleropages formosus TaxID=113540 RepID=UPI0008790255|nr:protein MAL2 isoform X2 [Scleropages formosus]
MSQSAAPNSSTAATSFPAPVISLPVGLDVLRTYSGALACLEIGWVMFVSVSTFVFSSAYLAVFLLGLVDRIDTDWNFLDMTYHFCALLFYFGAFVLEAATTAAHGHSYISVANVTSSGLLCLSRPAQNILVFMDDRQYRVNVAATIFAFVVTVCYGCSMFMGFKRWRK